MNTMIKAPKKWAMTVAAFVVSLAALYASRAEAQITLADPLGGNESFTSVATAVAGFLFWDVAAPLSVIMVLVGAFQLMTSSGDPEKVSKGRKTIMYAAIGLAIALVAGGAAKLVQNLVTGSS